MTVIVASHKDHIYGVYTDINLAKRAMKEKAPYVYKRIQFLPLEINDGLVIAETKALTDTWTRQGE